MNEEQTRKVMDAFLEAKRAHTEAVKSLDEARRNESAARNREAATAKTLKSAAQDVIDALGVKATAV